MPSRSTAGFLRCFPSVQRGRSPRRASLLLLTLVACLAALAPGAAGASSSHRQPRAGGAGGASSSLTWSLPEAIGTPSWAGEASSLAALACPSSRLCVAADRDGALLVSRTPARGAAGWRQLPVAPGADFVALSCPRTSLCLAVARDGRLFTSTSPTLSGSWTASAFTGLASVTGLACARWGPCVATDDAGDVATSASPTAPASTWAVAQVDAATRSCGSQRCQVALTGITCPASALCLAFDDAGQLVRSEDPTGGAQAWQTMAVDQHGPALTPGDGACEFGMCASIVCSGTASCVAVDSGGQVLTSPEPEGPATAWATHPSGSRSQPVALACPAAPSCLVADDSGEILSTGRPSGGSGAFQATQVEPLLADGAAAAGLTALSCPSTAECVGTDARGRIVVGTPPATLHQLQRLLRAAGGISGTASRIRTLLARRGFAIRLDAPQAGLLTVSWYPAAARVSGTALATGSVALPGPGFAQLKIALTGYGRRLLGAAQHEQIESVATFTSLSGSGTTLRRRHALKR